jgi:DNA processing protein
MEARMPELPSTPANTEELQAWALLVRSPSLDRERLLPALSAAGSAAALTQASSAQLARWQLPTPAIEYLRAPDMAAVRQDLEWLKAAPGRHLVPLDAPFYPPLLLQSVGAPVALYVRGIPAVLSLPQLAMVGSRNPTASGRETAFQFARHLAGCGLIITSGLAVGIDSASHRGALAAQQPTIAVCGCGLDIVYPEENDTLATDIERTGALVSEFPPGTPPLRQNFPQRNRIISGLALGTLVVEAASRSGSLITARFALEQGREVFAIPGSIHSPLSRGCHQLIRQGAKLVETGDDVLAELGVIAAAGTRAAAQVAQSGSASGGVAAGELDKEYEILLDALGFDPLGVDALVERSGLKPDAVASMLLILELQGAIEAHPGGRYCRRPGPVPRA